jgi:hypothetical protein
MARKTKEVVVKAEGRDQGKVFIITEMSAVRCEKWAWKVFLTLQRAGVTVGDMLGLGATATLSTFNPLNLLAGLKFEDVDPLLDELMACVQIQPSPGIIRPMVENDIEEIATRIKLESEAFELHTGFSIADVLSRPGSSSAVDQTLSS